MHRCSTFFLVCETAGGRLRAPCAGTGKQRVARGGGRRGACARWCGMCGWTPPPHLRSRARRRRRCRTPTWSLLLLLPPAAGRGRRPGCQSCGPCRHTARHRGLAVACPPPPWCAPHTERAGFRRCAARHSDEASAHAATAAAQLRRRLPGCPGAAGAERVPHLCPRVAANPPHRLSLSTPALQGC